MVQQRVGGIVDPPLKLPAPPNGWEVKPLSLSLPALLREYFVLTT